MPRPSRFARPWPPTANSGELSISFTLLDTSFVIDLLDGRPEAVALAAALDHDGEVVRIPAPVVFELWVGAVTARNTGEEVAKIEELLGTYETAPLDRNARVAP